MIINRVTAPTTPLVSLDDAKVHLRVDYADDDALIAALVGTAAENVEEMSGRALLTQSWKMEFPRASGEVELPVVPVRSLTSIQYYDRDETLQTADTSDFLLLKSEDKATVRPKTAAAWPETFARPDAVAITWSAGYGDVADVPLGLVHATKLMLAHLYEHREAAAAGVQFHEAPMAMQHLVNLHRVGWMAG